MNIIFSEHAIFEINRRKIKKENIENLVKYPPQKLDGKNNRIIIQGKYLDLTFKDVVKNNSNQPT
ncbi:MAG: hypothetical protein K0B37_15295 [Bacteroidales bacterium]|nr:hypothetical protein [Bacteroidales bacterium]